MEQTGLIPSQSLISVHVGGPWDGLVERRTITGTQTTAVIVQKAEDDVEAEWLLHNYDLVLSASSARLLYRGVDSSAVNPLTC